MSIFKYSFADKNELNIFKLALLFQFFWIITVNIGFHCDSPAYFSYAWKILGDPADNLPIWVRGVSYPLLILLTGTVGSKFSFTSFVPLLIIQAVMGILMPILVYKILLKFNKLLAYVVSIVIIISLQSVITSKLIMTEQAYKFLSIFIIYLVIEIYFKRKINLYYIILPFASFFIVFLKPQSIILIILCYLFLFIFNKYYLKKNTYSLLVFCILFFINSHLVCLSIPPNGSHETPYKPRSITSKIADLSFYTIYINGHIEKEKSNLDLLDNIFKSYSEEFEEKWLTNFPNPNIKKISIPKFNYVDYFFILPNARKYKDLKDIINLYNIYGKNNSFKISSNELISQYSISYYLDNPKLIFNYLYDYSFFRGGGSSQLLFNKLFSEYRSIKFDTNHGKYSAEFSDLIKEYFLAHSQEYREWVPDIYFSKYNNNVDAFLKNHLFGIPDAQLFFNYWLIIDDLKGHVESDKLFSNVIDESISYNFPNNHFKGYESLFLITKIQTYRFIFDPFLNFDYFYKIVYCAPNTSGGEGAKRWEWELNNGLRIFKKPVIIPNKFINQEPTDWFSNTDLWFINAESLFDKYVGWTWVIFHYASSLIILLFLPIALFSNLRFIITTLSLYLLSQAFISSSLVYAQIRYVDALQPFVFILAGLSILGSARVINIWFRFLNSKFSLFKN